MQIFGDKVIAFEILKFLDLEDLQKCQLVFPEIRKLLKLKTNKIHYLCKRYNLMSVDELHNYIIPGHEYLNEIHKTQLNQKIWWKCALRCVNNLHEQIKINRNSLPLDNADEHRSKNNHENICLDNQIQCDYCGYMDPQDVRKIFSHFFSCYPLFFSLGRELSFTHDNGGLFDIYLSGLSGPFNYYSTDSPYGKEVYEKFKLFIEKYDVKTQTNNYSLNPNYIPTEEDLTAIKRALLIPKWYLQKYFEYIVDAHNGLYQYVVKLANPGREQRLKCGDVKIYLNCAVCQDPPIIDDDSE